MATELKALQGIDTLLYIRLLEKAATETGHLIPFQTSLTFDPSRDTDTVQTKSGGVATVSSLETELEAEFVNNISKASDDLLESLLENKKIETWVVYRKRIKDDGKVYAIYMRGIVSEDSNDNDADDASTRDVTFTIDGTPKRGWMTLPDEAQEELDYVFHGMGQVTEQDKTGGGTAYSHATDAGK